MHRDEPLRHWEACPGMPGGPARGVPLREQCSWNLSQDRSPPSLALPVSYVKDGKRVSTTPKWKPTRDLETQARGGVDMA